MSTNSLLRCQISLIREWQLGTIAQRICIALVFLATMLAIGASNAAAQTAVYDAVEAPLAYGYPSYGFQARSTRELGDYVTLAGTNRVLNNVTVTMATWAYASATEGIGSAYCIANPTKCSPTGWKHNFTLNIYAVGVGTVGTRPVGALLASVTQEKDVPWRPEPTGAPCTGTTWEGPDFVCRNSFGFNLMFDMSSLNVTLPDDVVVGIAYNTQSHGYAAMGIAGPYNSLNVAARPGPAAVGSDDSTDRIFQNSTFGGFYGDGGAAGTGTFREDSGKSPNATIPIQITATPTYRVVDVTDGMASATDCNAVDPAFTSIQAAVDSADAGDVVKVCPGTYNENITVPSTKAGLQLLGAKAGIAAGPSASPVNRGTDESIIIGQASPGTRPIHLNGVSNAVVDGFTLRSLGNAGQSAVYSTGTGNTIRNNIMEGSTFGAATGFSSGVQTGDFISTSVLNNNISGFRYGMNIDGNIGNAPGTVSGNYITGSTVASMLFNGGVADGQTISGNVMTNNPGGLVLAQGGHQVTGNTITNTTGSGIFLFATARTNNISIIGNRLVGNGSGINMQAGVGNSGHVIKFNAFIGSTGGFGINANNSTPVDATDNWWGCNYGPGTPGAGCVGTPNGIGGTNAANVVADPWLVLTTSASASPILVGQNSTVTSLLTTNSDSNTPTGGFVTDTTPATFVGTFGSVAPANGTTTAGSAGTVFTATSSGVGGVATTVDGQTVNAPVVVYAATCAAVSIPTNITTLRNQTVIVPIKVDEMTGRGAFGYEATVTYDPTKLTYQSFSTTGTLSSGLEVLVDSSNSGVLLIAAATPGSGPELAGSGDLLKLNFLASGNISSVATPVNFTNFVFNEDDPCSNETNGSVTIISSTVSGNVNYINAPGGVRPVPNATLTADGSVDVSTNTNTSGNYTLSGLGSGAYTVTPSKTAQPIGSNNGITNSDTTRILQYLVGQASLNPTQLIAADVTGNGTVSNLDASRIAQWSTGIVATPNLTGTWKFLPPYREYTDVETQYENENYDAILMGDVTGNWSPTGDPGLVSSEGLWEETKDTVVIRAPREEVQSSTVVSVPITISDTTEKGITGYQFDVVYDPSVLEPDVSGAAVAGPVSAGLSVVANAPENGRLKVFVYGVLPLKGEGHLLDLRFNTIGPVGSATKLVIENLMLNEGEVKAGAYSGEIVIREAGTENKLSGRILNPFGEGVSGARVTITATTGEARSSTSNSFGYFEFGNLKVGEMYTITVSSKRYRFDAQSISHPGSNMTLDLIGQE